MPDISLVPEPMRQKEHAAVEKQKTAPPKGPAELRMHIPESTADEDIEIIEVDEGDLDAILADEPLFTRWSYRLSVGFDALKDRLLKTKGKAPPPKLPEQFFTPPKPGLATVPGARPPGRPGSAPASRARITPQGEAPRRVRVIRRVRKPVRVSLITDEDVLPYLVDVPRRKWTLVVCSLLFIAVIGGGYWLLTLRITQAQGSLQELDRQLADTRSDIVTQESQWNTYRDLQQRLVLLDGILDQHVVVSRLFDFLERRTIPEVTYHSATLSPDGILSLDVSADSFDSAARQLVAFERSTSTVLSADATAFGAQVDEEGRAIQVAFQLTLRIDPASLRGPDAGGNVAGIMTSLPEPSDPIVTAMPALVGSSSSAPAGAVPDHTP